jgi:hypothetical protein
VFEVVELVEPKPLISPRGLVVLFLGFLLVLFVGWFGLIAVQGEKALTECAMQRHPPTQTTVVFTFFPPGYDCVYLSDRGQVLGRSRWTPNP